MSRGWLWRGWHASGASLFFLLIYTHIGRGIFYSSYIYINVWISGVTLLLLLIATAFLGYVLPWGQISFWGATVITNLFSAVPVIGLDLVQYLWGGYSISGPTLNRFFTLHFFLPFVLFFLRGIHVFFLHRTGSNNPLGITSRENKTLFSPYSAFSDLDIFRLCFLYFILFIFLGYLVLVDDPDNFINANPLIAPPHIQPEWYFLFAYAILRAIPNKLGGVLALVGSILVLYTLPIGPEKKFLSRSFSPHLRVLFWGLVVTVSLLTWIGACAVEAPYTLIGQLLTSIYFIYFILQVSFKG